MPANPEAGGEVTVRRSVLVMAEQALRKVKGPPWTDLTQEAHLSAEALAAALAQPIAERPERTYTLYVCPHCGSLYGPRLDHYPMDCAACNQLKPGERLRKIEVAPIPSGGEAEALDPSAIGDAAVERERGRECNHMWDRGYYSNWRTQRCIFCGIERRIR